MTAIVALTAQNTMGVTAVQELPPTFVGRSSRRSSTTSAWTRRRPGCFSRAPLIETVADFLDVQPVPLVVDPVMVASSGAQLLPDDAVERLVDRLFPLATVVTPNLPEAEALAGRAAHERELAERIHELGAPAVIVTGGHGEEPSTTFSTAGSSRDRSRAPRRRGDPRRRLHAFGDPHRPAWPGARASRRLRGKLRESHPKRCETG